MAFFEKKIAKLAKFTQEKQKFKNIPIYWIEHFFKLYLLFL